MIGLIAKRGVMTVSAADKKDRGRRAVVTQALQHRSQFFAGNIFPTLVENECFCALGDRAEQEFGFPLFQRLARQRPWRFEFLQGDICKPDAPAKTLSPDG